MANDSGGGIHLLSARYAPPLEPPDGYPFSLPTVRALEAIAFEAPVTVVVGENGSGKSTLLEALAAAAGLPAVGGDEIEDDASMVASRRLAACLELRWRKRTRRGFFLRAEDFFAFCKRISAMRAGLLRDMADTEAQFAGRSAYARNLALGPLRASVGELDTRYGTNLDANSHGEAFLKLFQARFSPEGLHILDEPEAALSPTRQLALMAMIREMVAARSQFIIATHSPILMAYPGAAILSCDEVPLRRVKYGDLEAVALMRDFLNGPERFLKHLD